MAIEKIHEKMAEKTEDYMHELLEIQTEKLNLEASIKTSISSKSNTHKSTQE